MQVYLRDGVHLARQCAGHSKFMITNKSLMVETVVDYSHDSENRSMKERNTKRTHQIRERSNLLLSDLFVVVVVVLFGFFVFCFVFSLLLLLLFFLSLLILGRIHL